MQSHKIEEQLSLFQNNLDIIRDIASEVSPRAREWLDRISNKFNEQPEENPAIPIINWQYNINKSLLMSKCGKDISGQQIFQCSDCKVLSNACLCKQCWEGGNHEGHTTNSYVSYGATCDCGIIQYWRQQGFCKQHGANVMQNIQKISQEEADLFLMELKFAFYIHFILDADPKTKAMQDLKFGPELIEYLSSWTQKNVEVRELITKLLSQKFDDPYPVLPKPERDTIIQRLISLDTEDEDSTLYNFTKLEVKLRSVKQFNELSVVTIYKKMNINCASEYIYGNLNNFISNSFSNTTIILQLISEGKIRAFQAQKVSINSAAQLGQTFKKMFSYLKSIGKSKNCVNYYKIHLKQQNMANFAWYRVNEYAKQVGLDIECIQTILPMIRQCRSEKEILLKCVGDLFKFLAELPENENHSMIQESLLVLVLSAYCDGNLDKLKQKSFCDEIIGSMKYSQSQFTNILKRLLGISMYRTALQLSRDSQNAEIINLDLYSYLPVIYNRILLHFNQHYQTNQYFLDYSLNKLLSQKSDAKLFQKISIIISKTIGILSIKVEELTLAEELKIQRIDDMRQFYKRLLGSLSSKMSSYDFRTQTRYTISNGNAIDLFMAEDVVIVDETVERCKQSVAPLPTLLYSSIFKRFQYYEATPFFTPLQLAEQLNNYNKIEIIEEPTLILLLKYLKWYVQKSFTQQPGDCEIAKVPKLLNNLVPFYLLTRNQLLKQFIIQSIRPQNDREIYISESFIEQVQIIQEAQPQKLKQINQILNNDLKIVAESISPRIKSIYDQLLRIVVEKKQQEQLDFNVLSYDFEESSFSPICSKKNGTETFYQCYDCVESLNGAVCQECFLNGDHTGHNYTEFTQSSQVCDCGNLQAWKDQGSCIVHGHNEESLEDKRSQAKAEIYIKQMQFAFYVYFMSICNSQTSKHLRSLKYDQKLFNFLSGLNAKSYEVKKFTTKLLLSKLENYPHLNKINFKYNILEIFFRLNRKTHGLTDFKDLLVELFPVSLLRQNVIINYFHKTNRVTEQLFLDHPLGDLSSKFLACVKQIVSLIDKKIIGPFQLPQYIYFSSSIMQSAYNKLFNDFKDINNMKAVREYHRRHIESVDMSKFAYYRVWYKLTKDVSLGDAGLTILISFAKSLKNDKQLLAKGIKDIFNFLANQVNEQSCSYSQEGTFGLFVLAYCEGDLSNLFNRQYSDALIKSMGYNDETFAVKLKILVDKTIGMTLYYLRDRGLQDRQSLSRNISTDLTIIHNRVLIILSQHYLPSIYYADQYINRVFKSEDQIEEKMESIVLCLVNLTVSSTVKLNQLVISHKIEIDNIHNICKFYQRLLQNFSHLNSKAFKRKALQLINSPHAFQVFCEKYVNIQGGKLKNKTKISALESLFYENLLRDFYDEAAYTRPAPIENKDEISLISNGKILSEKAISQIMEIFEDYKINYCSTSRYTQNCFEMNKALIPIFFLTKSDILNIYFIGILTDEDKRCKLPEEYQKQISFVLVSGQEEQQKKITQAVVQNERKQKQRKQKLKNKLKERGNQIKKQQQEMLKQYEQSHQPIEQVKQEDISDLCLVCKGRSNELINYMAVINFTNLIENKVFVSSDKHLIFTTCGHKVHRSCYFKANQSDRYTHCFFCKAECNALFPLFNSSQFSKTQLAIKIEQFLDNIQEFLRKEDDKEFANLFLKPVKQNQQQGNQQNQEVNQQQNQQISYEQREIKKITQQQKFAKQLQISKLKIQILDYQVYQKNSRETDPNFNETLEARKLKQQTEFSEELQRCKQKVNEKKPYLLSLLAASLMKELLFSGLHQFKYFIRHQLVAMQQIFYILQNYPLKFEKHIFKIKTQTTKTIGSALNYTIDSILKKLQVSTENTEYKLNSEQLTTINNFIEGFVSFDNDKMQNNQLSFINFSEFFFSVPNQLTELKKIIQYCPLCNKFSQKIYICMICEWKACRNCYDHIDEHSRVNHISGTIFIKMHSGQIQYFYKDSTVDVDSIYQDSLGEPWSTEQYLRPQKFKLNKARLMRLHQEILENEIHRVIFNDNR